MLIKIWLPFVYLAMCNYVTTTTPNQQSTTNILKYRYQQPTTQQHKMEELSQCEADFTETTPKVNKVAEADFVETIEPRVNNLAHRCVTMKSVHLNTIEKIKRESRFFSIKTSRY